MTDARYGFVKKLPGLSFAEAEAKVRDALAGQGFGILTEIDVQATLKKKLDVDFKPYKILGACNPGLAHKGLSAETHLGLLLPCNVVLQAEAEGAVTLSVLRPKMMTEMVDGGVLDEVAGAADEKLRAALDALG
jgi:uncharacterized protein (DUF302 family)